MSEVKREWAPHMTIKTGETLTITHDGRALWWITVPQPNRWRMKQQRVRERRVLRAKFAEVRTKMVARRAISKAPA